MSTSHVDDSGNRRVDFVWGNLPMQPNNQRLDSEIYTAGEENVGWSGTTLYYSDTLQSSDYEVVLNNLTYLLPADSHSIATTGYSNFPSFLPNYEGDGDTGFETVVPGLMRKSLAQAEVDLDKANLNLWATAHNPEIFGIVSTGTTIRIYCYDTNPWDDELALVGLRVGDKIWVDNSEYDFGGPVTITALNADGEASWLEFEYTEEPVELDTEAMGTIWPGPDLVNVITVVRFWNPEGSIKNEGTNIHVRYLGD